MFNFFRNLFGKWSSNSLSTRTSSILDVFNSTIKNLSKVVDEAKKQAKRQEAKIIIATKEKEALENIAESNSAIIGKMENLLKS